MSSRKSSPRKSPKKSPKKSPRSPMRRNTKSVDYNLNEVDVAPSKEIFKVMNMFAYLFVLCAIASICAWIYYLTKAMDQKLLDVNDKTEIIDIAEVCYQALVIAALLYVVARHHFNSGHF